MLLIILTVLSTSVALVMTVVAWRVWREEQRRSDARVAALAADIASGLDAPADVYRSPAPRALSEPAPLAASTTGLFRVSSAPAAHARWGVSLVAGVLAIAAVAAIAVIFSGESRSASVAAASRGGAPTSRRGSGSAPPAAAGPLELVALTHEREGASLRVRGVVHQPPGGQVDGPLTAVVFGFDRDGGFVTSGRGPVGPSGTPGDSTFLLTIPDATGVVRYRVSFRTDDRVVPHVDRRATR
jgi:hypothetical protein